MSSFISNFFTSIFASGFGIAFTSSGFGNGFYSNFNCNPSLAEFGFVVGRSAEVAEGFSCFNELSTNVYY